MKPQLLRALGVVLVSALPAAYLALTWSSIPAQVSVHFSLEMVPDRIGPKEELWLPVGVLAGVAILLYFILNNIPRIDPKRKAAGKANFYKLSIALVVFLTILNALIITGALKGGAAVRPFFLPLIGVMYVVMGNYMNNLKPNYFAGFRLPWTLSSDDNWRRTHRLAGKLYFGAGIIFIALSFIFSWSEMLLVFIAISILINLIPTIYSFVLFRKSKALNNQS